MDGLILNVNALEVLYKLDMTIVVGTINSSVVKTRRLTITNDNMFN